MMTWRDPLTLTYAIGTLPADVEWGKDKPFDNKAAVLCKPNSNLPYTIWIVGRASKTWFFDNNGPAAQVNIILVPLDVADGIATRKLVASHSHLAICMYHAR